MSPYNPTHFKKGDKVEVRDATTTTSATHNSKNPIWFPATVLRPLPPHKLYVVFDTLLPDGENTRKHLKEYVEMGRVRPLPPLELHRCYKVGDSVEVYQEKGWVKGEVRDILVNSKYLVAFSSNSSEDTGVEEEEVELWRMRAHIEWVDGCWFSPLLESKCEMQGESLDLKPKQLKLKIKYSRKTSEPEFSNGTMVEVRSNEEGYQGSWYTAVVVGSAGNDKFLVEYKTLKTDDESEQLREKADASYIRPCPPEIQRIDRFKMLEEVDAWYNDGWWVGLVSKVLTGLKYGVYFWTTNEELVFDHFKLRPHQEWINGKWVASFLKRSKLPVKTRKGKPKRQHDGLISELNLVSGIKVEIGSDEEGYLGSWYPAVIIRPVRKGKLLVLYQTLKTDDGLEPLIEEVDAPSIRPCPPINQRADRFKPLDEVDVWYNDGWWSGQVCKVLEGSSYSIHIRCTNEVLEFQHINLRPHQDWIDGKWIVAIRGRAL